MSPNQDRDTIADFGNEWSRFRQESSADDFDAIGDKYFSIFPFDKIGRDSVGFDMGTGSGRWAALIAPRVKKLYCVDPSIKALEVAKEKLSHFDNCVFENATADDFSVPEGSMDFGYSLGVLHHVPNTQQALNKCVAKLKSGAPFLCYLYYSFENRGPAFKALWLASDKLRKVIAPLPVATKERIADALAALVYFPLARSAKLMDMAGLPTERWPLSFYKDRSFYTMRTDSLDRFGTRLEQRFSRAEIRQMMETAGLQDIRFSDQEPFWVSVGIKK